MINKVILQGNFCQNPELKHTNNDIAVTSFSLAWSEKNKNQENEKVYFARCVAWRNTAEFICKYFKKGTQALIEGELISRSYEKDGEQKTLTEIVINNIHFCGKKDDNNNKDEKPYEGEQNQFSDNLYREDEDLPF